MNIEYPKYPKDVEGWAERVVKKIMNLEEVEPAIKGRAFEGRSAEYPI